MGPAVVGRGTQQAVDYYKLLLDELEERVEMSVGAVDDERFRVYWEGMPVWGRLRVHSELFAGLDSCVLASTYCNSWIFSDLDPEDPFMSMARAYTKLFIVRSDGAKEKYIKEMLDFFDVDGLAKTALDALRAPAQFEVLQHAGRRMIEDLYSLDICLPQMVALYERVVGNRPS